MFTQCPSCETTFQVTADQLKAASGDVRCGQCLAVFNALDNLSEAAPFTTGVEGELSSAAKNSFAKNASTSIDKNLEEFFGDLFEDSPNETFDKPLTYAKPEPSPGTTSKPNNGFFYGANEATIEKILEARDIGYLEPIGEEEDKVDADVDSEIDYKSEPVEPQTKGIYDPEAAETTFISETSSPETRTGLSVSTSVPDVLLDELQAAKAQQLQPPVTQWAVGSIVLMLVFVLQAVYFSRDTLARNPGFRPLLTSACEVLGCEINIKFDPRLIEIIGRDVRSHPSSQKALIAGTTLINNASYAQPYPLLTLTFADITGTKLAQRRFTPREYLRSGTDIGAGMPPEIPVQVELHLVDPGKAAVNFEFRAEVDPRS